MKNVVVRIATTLDSSAGVLLINYMGLCDQRDCNPEDEKDCEHVREARSMQDATMLFEREMKLLKRDSIKKLQEIWRNDGAPLEERVFEVVSFLDDVVDEQTTAAAAKEKEVESATCKLSFESEEKWPKILNSIISEDYASIEEVYIKLLAAQLST